MFEGGLIQITVLQQALPCLFVVIVLLILIRQIDITTTTIEALESTSIEEAQSVASELSDLTWQLYRVRYVLQRKDSPNTLIGAYVKFYNNIEGKCLKIYLPVVHSDFSKIDDMYIGTKVRLSYSNIAQNNINDRNPMAYLRIVRFNNPTRRRVRIIFYQKTKNSFASERVFNLNLIFK